MHVYFVLAGYAAVGVVGLVVGLLVGANNPGLVKKDASTVQAAAAPVVAQAVAAVQSKVNPPKAS